MAEYIEREAISEEIRKYYYKNPPNFSYGEGFDRGLDRAQRAILDAPAADVAPVRKWISVKDRLPEPKENAICLNRHGDMMIGTYTEWGWMFPCYFEGPTHWMQLPQPPKGE